MTSTADPNRSLSGPREQRSGIVHFTPLARLEPIDPIDEIAEVSEKVQYLRRRVADGSLQPEHTVLASAVAQVRRTRGGGPKPIDGHTETHSDSVQFTLNVPF